MTPALPAGSIVLFVDGTCIFCNRLVSYILRRDRRGIFHFAHLQGELAATVLGRHGRAPDPDVIYAVSDLDGPNERVWLDGAAARQIWPRLFWFAAVLRLVPLWLLNLQYRAFARIRYRLYGQAESCIAPCAEERARFLS
jgi:predicted DCC family thiol-disulfide oxidoreductase YuxK